MDAVRLRNEQAGGSIPNGIEDRVVTKIGPARLPNMQNLLAQIMERLGQIKSPPAAIPPSCLPRCRPGSARRRRSEEHTSELQSLMRISYAVFCLKKQTTHTTHTCTMIPTSIYH